MKRVALILAFLMCLGSFAYAEVGFGLGAQAGASFSSFPDPLGEYYGTGFGGGVFGDINVEKFFTGRLSFDYFTFSSDKDKYAQLIANQFGGQASDYKVEGLNISVFSIYAHGLGKIPTDGPVTPYGVIGLGMNMLSTSDLKVTSNQGGTSTGTVESKTEFGLDFGAGVEYQLSSVALFFEGKYVLIFTENESSAHIPLVVGVKYGL